MINTVVGYMYTTVPKVLLNDNSCLLLSEVSPYPPAPIVALNDDHRLLHQLTVPHLTYLHIHQQYY